MLVATDGRFSADTVEKLLFRSYSKNSRPVDASLLPGREGPGDLPLHATRVVLINAATIRGVNCRLQRTDARIRGHCNLEFFNRIGPLRSYALPERRRSRAAVSGTARSRQYEIDTLNQPARLRGINA